MIGNHLLKITAHSIATPLCRLFNYSLNTHTYPSSWKRSNVIPVHKKNSKQDKKNYRPISLLCNVSKVFERIVHNKLYNYLTSNELLIPQNSGFKKQDGTVNQLTAITDKIYKFLEKSSDVRMVFLDLSKAFDRVWHKGLLHKLKQLGITGPLLEWFKSYLENRTQRVVINGQKSDFLPLEAGVPQGSILGPLLFLIFMNDIIKHIQSHINLFADDASLLAEIVDPELTQAILNNDIAHILNWAKQWLMIFNIEKTIDLAFTLKLNPVPQPTLFFDGSPIKQVKEHCHLGLHFSSDMKWNTHVNNICKRASQRNCILQKFKYRLPRKSLETIYKTMIRPILEYADVVFDGCGTVLTQRLESIQYNAARTCLGALRTTNLKSLLDETGWETLAVRRKTHKMSLYYKMCNGLVPDYLQRLVPPLVSQTTRYNLRNSHNQVTIPTRTTRYKESFLPSTINLWNNLPLEIRNSRSLGTFKSKVHNYFAVKTPPPSWFYFGNRFPNVLHTRLRLGSSTLNSHLFKVGRAESCSCSCANPSETPKHYLLECPNYSTQRDALLVQIRDLLAPGTHRTLIMNLDTNYFFNLLLRGSTENSDHVNITLFAAIQEFIISTGRFSKK